MPVPGERAQGVAQMVATHARRDNPKCLPLTLTTEVGIVGGFPAGGLRFGAAHNSAAAMPCASMLDFYNGAGADVACLGMAEVPFLPICTLPLDAHPHMLLQPYSDGNHVVLGMV